MEIPLLNSWKSALIKGEIKKSLNKLDPSLVVPALDNLLDSVGLVAKDAKEVKTEIGNKLMELIRGLN